jgi:HEAT repeat protein
MRRKACALSIAMGTLLFLGRPCDAGQGKLEELLKGLESPNPAARAMAATALTRMGPGAEPAVPALAKALADQDLDVRYWAASALKAVGPAAHAAVTALVKALDTFPGGSPALDGPVRYYADVRSVAAEALGVIGNRAKDALPALKKALTDPEPAVRSAAADALQRIGVRSPRRVSSHDLTENLRVYQRP